MLGNWFNVVFFPTGDVLTMHPDSCQLRGALFKGPIV